MMRVVSWFSCGAASAVATFLAAIKYGEIEAVYCRVVEEHEDNLRFLDDFTRVTGIPVKVIMDEQHEGSIYKVFMKRRFIKNEHGAPCTMILKKDMRKSYQRPGDIQVFGYTIEEQDRADRFIDGNNDVTEDFILIDNGLSKQDCYSHLLRLGLKLPVMYSLGYSNNNCVGCVKGGMGYWNKIKVDFPIHFQRISDLERLKNQSVLKDRFLDELKTTDGNYPEEPKLECSIFCQMAEEDYQQGETK